MKLSETNTEIAGLKVLTIFFSIITLIALFLKLFYALPFYDSIRWYFGVFIFFYIPGNLLLLGSKKLFFYEDPSKTQKKEGLIA